ncbi:cutinase family protein [Williamsia sp. CHRR-6]|uniref:cutinase family protein n=1 Tax=Williamsia sp. CHRR-6 TaxID=2835871 RepID=UPI001BDB2301|nr:cutinase family protein [Williamsia sp. CHRR-6]MBT0568257.1 cutinase family protein [Williamsia sp. CHRR-6]
MLRRLLAAATVLVALITTLVIGGTGTASARGCPDVEVIFARGTAEPGAPLGVTGASFVAAVRGALPGRSVNAYAVNYAASSNFRDRIGLARSVTKGVIDAQNRITFMASACSRTRLVLGGYSQGAIVAAYATSSQVTLPPSYTFLAPPVLPAAVAPRVAAVALFAVPSTRFLADAGAPRYVPSPLYRNRTVRFCIPGDNICNGARLALPGPLHVLYAANGDTLRAAGFVRSRL